MSFAADLALLLVGGAGARSTTPLDSPPGEYRLCLTGKHHGKQCAGLG